MQVRQMCVRTLRFTVVQEGVTTEHSAMGFNLPMPPEGIVWDYMFDFDAIRWVCSMIGIKGSHRKVCERMLLWEVSC